MAFTATQREQIYQFLGYDALALDDDLEERIAAVELTAASEATVAALLTQIIAVEAKIATTSASGDRGPLKRADDIEFHDLKDGQMVATASLEYGRLLVSRLAVRFGLDPDALPSDYFGIGMNLRAGVAGGCLPNW